MCKKNESEQNSAAEKLSGENYKKLFGKVVSLSTKKIIKGTAVHIQTDADLPVTVAQRPFILLINDGTIHSFDIKPTLFYTAEAIVMAVGGSLAHISIIARESNIPAISGVPVNEIPAGALITIEIVMENNEPKAVIKF